MPPVRSDVVPALYASPCAPTHNHYTRQAAAQGLASDFIQTHCTLDPSVLARLPAGLRAKTRSILSALEPCEAFDFLGLSGVRQLSSSTTMPRQRAQQAALRQLVGMPARRRRAVVRQGYALLGASLLPRERTAGVKTLGLASSFGCARLAHFVRLCAPPDATPHDQARLLQRLWYEVRPARLPLLFAMCQPMLARRRGMPHVSARMMQQLVDDEGWRQSRRTWQPRTRAVLVVNARPRFTSYVGDLDENVMQTSRVEATCNAICLIRDQLPHALPSSAALKALQFFILGTASAASAELRTTCGLAWATLTGNRAPFDYEPAAGQAGRSTVAPAAPLAELDDSVVAHYPWLVGHVSLDRTGSAKILLRDVLSLVWQHVSSYQAPQGGYAATMQARDNLRYSLLRALAECSIDGPVCNIGKSQRIVSVLQGYLPFAIDGLEERAEPLAVVTYMLQGLANELDPYLDMSHAGFTSLDGVGRAAHVRARVQRFMQEAAQTGEALFGAHSKDHAQFTAHLRDAVRYDYDGFLPRSPTPDAPLTTAFARH